VQKPLQNIYTAVLFVSCLTLTVFGGVQAVSVFEQSGLVHTAAPPVIIAVDDMDTLDEGLFAADEISGKECEMVYHRASQGNVYLDGYPYLVADVDNVAWIKNLNATAEEDLDDMGVLYYALYTCSGAVVIADGFI
jgi:hypothetical protein